MPDQAEAKMIRAAFLLIKNDMGVKARGWKVVRLLEGKLMLTNPGQGYMSVSGIPVKPDEKPSSRFKVYTDLYIQPTYDDENTATDSSLTMTNEYVELRKLLSSNLPLIDPDDSTKNCSDDYLDFDYRGTDFRTVGFRRPLFVARFCVDINPQTGLKE